MGTNISTGGSKKIGFGSGNCRSWYETKFKYEAKVD